MQNGRARRGLFCRQFGAVGEGSAFDDLVIVVTCKSTRFHPRFVKTFISNDCDSSMYYHFVLAAIEMPWYIAIAVMVLCFFIATLIVMYLVKYAQTRRLALTCSVVDNFLIAQRHDSKMKDRSRTATSTDVASHLDALFGISMAGLTLDEQGEISMAGSGGRDSRFGWFSAPAFYSRLSCNGLDFGYPTAKLETHYKYNEVVL